jgi:hypothetical protein
MSLIFQRVPEAFQSDSNLDGSLSFHGLTRATMSAEMIRWVDSIRLESPDLHRAILYDPPYMKTKMGIRIWDFCLSTGMTTDYPVRRGWNDFMGVREFVQNSLDIEERSFGYEGIEVGARVDEIGLHISDRGPGITYEAFRLGGSDKSCYERGYYGEGLKVAMAHFANRGCPVYVFNRHGQVFKAFVSPGTNLVLIAIGRANPVAGTEVIVYALPEKSPEWSDVAYVRRIIFKEWLRQDPNLYVLTVKKWMTDTCKADRPNFIIGHLEEKTNVDFLWVRDISVNRISTITSYPSIFGYNLWWCELEPNRITVSSVPDLGKQTAKAFDVKAVRKLLDKVVDGTKVKEGLFETQTIDWWSASDEAKNEVASWIKEHGYGYTDNERALDWALYLGVKPLVVSYNMKYLFSKAQTLEDIIMTKGLNRIATAEENVVVPESLTLKERCNLRAAEVILENVHTQIWGRDKLAPPIKTTEKIDAAGTASMEKIYILRTSLDTAEETVETVLHEYSHYYGKLAYGAARDISDAFEHALGYVASQVAFIPEQARTAFVRARHGAWNAKNIVWKEGKYRSLPTLSERFAKALIEGTKQLGIPEPRIGLSPYAAEEINYSIPLVVAVHFTSWELNNILKKGVWLEISPTFYDKKHYVEDILDWDLPYARFDLYRATIEGRLKEMEEKCGRYPEKAHVMLLYNPEKDDYEVWKVIQLRQTSY